MPSHILRPQRPHLLIQMFPQHIPKPIHKPLHLLPLQVNLATPALGQIILQLLQTLVDLPVLREEVQFTPELGHPFREHREDVLPLDRVVEVELRAEAKPGHNELARGESAGLFACAGAGVLQLVPS